MEFKLKATAGNFRSKMGLSTTEPLNFNGLIRRLDILTVFTPLGNDFSGMSIIADDDKFMLVNSAQSAGRQNFTICHELYHIFYDPEFTPHKCKTGYFPKKDKSELNADNFASFLLLPEDGIIDMIPDYEMSKNSTSLATLLKIEQTYGASRRALLMRLLKMRLIDNNFYEEYCHDVLRGAKRYGYSTDLYLPSNNQIIIGSYGELANKLFEKDKISEGHYRELLSTIGIDITEIMTDEEDRSE